MKGAADLSRRRLIAGSTLGVAVLIGLAFFAVANYFGWKYHHRSDWTSSELYTLSEKTENTLAVLDQDLDVVVFLNPADPLYQPVRELLARYEAASPRISVREVDPEKNILEAQKVVDQYELDRLNVVVFNTGDGKKVLDAASLAEYDFSGAQFGQGPEMTGFKGEQAFTSAIMELTQRRRPKVLFSAGHGEREIEDLSASGLSAFRELLARDNFESDSWASLGQSSLPADADVIVVGGPTSTFIEQELDLLRSYLDGGGRLLVLLDPILTAEGTLLQTGLEPLLAEYGVEVGTDIVVDPANPLPFFGAETIFVNKFGDHVITDSLAGAQLSLIVPMARSAAAGTSESLAITELVTTTEEGWGETDLMNLDRVERQDTDTPGPVSIAVAVSPKTEAEGDLEVGDLATDEDSATEQSEPSIDGQVPAGMRLVVVGDSDFVSNAQMRNVPNETFAANALNWLVERETLVGIPPKMPEQVRLNLTQGQLSRVTWLVLVVLPGLAVALGIAVYLRRRR